MPLSHGRAFKITRYSHIDLFGLLAKEDFISRIHDHQYGLYFNSSWEAGSQNTLEVLTSLPTLKIPFSEAILDSQDGRAFLPEEKLLKIESTSETPNQIVTFFRLMGLMASTTYVTLYTHLRMRLQQWLARNYQSSLDSICIKLSLPKEMLFSFKRWNQSTIFWKRYHSILHCISNYSFACIQPMVGCSVQ